MQQVAQVLKSNGTDGELVMGFREIAPEDINLKEPVFIIFDGLPVPFFIESFTKRGNSKALVRLTDICSMEDVEEIAGKAVYVEEDSLPELSLEEDGYAELVGWTVLVPGDFSTPLRSGRNDNMEESGQSDTIEETGRNDNMEESGQSDTIEKSGRNDNVEGVGRGDDRVSAIGDEAEFIEVGQITDFMDIPNNPCIEVETENGAVILPLHEDFILSVDPEYQEIIMQIPAGLI